MSSEITFFLVLVLFVFSPPSAAFFSQLTETAKGLFNDYLVNTPPINPILVTKVTSWAAPSDRAGGMMLIAPFVASNSHF